VKRTKNCRACGQDKHPHEFNGSSKSVDGRAPRCRACVNKARRARERAKKGAPRSRVSAIRATRIGDVESIRAWLDRCPSERIDGALAFLLEHTVRDYRTVKKTKGHSEIVKFLIERGAVPHPYLVGEAAKGGNRELIDVLLSRGATRTLHAVAALGDVAAVKRALKRNPARAAEGDPPIDLELGSHTVVRGDASPLHYAAWSSLGLADDAVAADLEEVASRLLDAGASLDHEDREGQKPLRYAVHRGGNPKLVRVLLEYGARFDDHDFPDVLRQLQRNDAGQAEIADLMWESGAVDRSEVRRRGVHGYAQQGIGKIVRWLLDRGTDVDQRDDAGRTALHWVCERQSSPTMARLLLDRGAALTPVDAAGKTPLELAILNERSKVAELLRVRASSSV